MGTSLTAADLLGRGPPPRLPSVTPPPAHTWDWQRWGPGCKSLRAPPISPEAPSPILRKTWSPAVKRPRVAGISAAGVPLRA